MNTLFKAVIVAAVLLAAAPAYAKDGVWKVGNSYVIRFEKLDLAQAADRQTLLSQIERASAKTCRGEATKARRQICQTVQINTALGTLQPDARDAVETARLERATVMQAQR